MIIYDSPTVTYDDASYDYSGLFIGVVVSWAVVVLSSIVVGSASLLSVMRSTVDKTSNLRNTIGETSTLRKTTSEASTMHKTLTLSSPLNG